MAHKSDDESLTALLREAHGGNREAAERAYRVLYPELCKIARGHLRTHRPDTLLDTEGLVFESYLNLAKLDGEIFENRRHFYVYAAKVMRHIVIDFSRRRQAKRHGSGAAEVELTTGIAEIEKDIGSVLDVERILNQLEQLEPIAAGVVEMRYFGGYSDAEIAEALARQELRLTIVTTSDLPADWGCFIGPPDRCTSAVGSTVFSPDLSATC